MMTVHGEELVAVLAEKKCFDTIPRLPKDVQRKANKKSDKLSWTKRGAVVALTCIVLVSTCCLVRFVSLRATV